MLLHNGASDGNFTHNTAFKCFNTIFTSYTLNDIYRYFSNTLDVAQTRSMKRFYLDLLFQSLAFLRKLLMLLSFSHQHLQRCFYALCFLIFFTDSIHFLGSIDCRRFFHNLFFSSEVNRLPFLLPKFSLQIAVEEKSELTTSRFFFYLDKFPYDSTREDSKSSPKRNVSRPTVTLRLKKTWPYLENGAVDDATNQPYTHDFANGWGLTKKWLCRLVKPEHAVRECEYAAPTTGYGILDLLALFLSLRRRCGRMSSLCDSTLLPPNSIGLDCLDPEFKNCGCRLLHYMSIGNNKESVVEPVPTLWGGLAGNGWEVTRASCCVWNMKCTYSS